MPKVSDRGNLMPESPIRKLAPYADQAKEDGIKVYHLNIGQPDIKTPECALDAIRNLSSTVIEYTHSAGNKSYRDKLTTFYAGYGIEISSEEMLVTSGGSEAIVFAMLSCLNPGDEIIIPEPFYSNYKGFSVMAGVKVIPITSSIENGFALPPIAEFEKLVTDKTRAILICNPNNPTGYLYSENELKDLGEIVKKHDLYLFCDEVYRDFCYDSIEYVSALNIKGIENNVVMIDSVSKRFSACGVRIGVMASRNQEVIGAALKFAQTRLSAPGLGQIAGEAALDAELDYLESAHSEYLSRRDCLLEEINKIEGVYAPSPTGAFYLMVQLPIDDSDKFCKWLLSEFSYEGETVMLAPATGFYETEGLGEDQVRIAYILKKEDLRKAVTILNNALKVYPGSTLR